MSISNKKESIKRIINVALSEIVLYKGLPKDESESASCKDFLSLVCQYTNSYATKKETRIILNDILDNKLEEFDNKTLKEVLMEHITEDKIAIKEVKKNKIKRR